MLAPGFVASLGFRCSASSGRRAVWHSIGEAARTFGIAGLVVAVASISGCTTQAERVEESDLPSRQVTRCDKPAPAFRVADSGDTDYDPWESFNQHTFWFNHDVLDRYALKPAATAWHDTVPHPVRRSLANAFDNLAMPKRVVNDALQTRFSGAGRELARFLLNTTVGIAGLFDVATRLGMDKSDADTGQTLATYNVRAGPYLVLPLLPPMTVRDGIGLGVDSLLDPLSYFLTPFGADIGMTAGHTVNERAENLELYQDAEDTVLDLYAAVRNGYLQRRHKNVEDAIEDRDHPENDYRSFSACVSLGRATRQQELAQTRSGF
jgi:phospholipid-binding lipoprotein MlaA